MQIKAITVNAAGTMAAGPGIREKGDQVRPEGSLFGPECRVTISQEGRNRGPARRKRQKGESIAPSAG